MVKRLTNLVINEVSSVDAGAGRGVKILLMKRDTPGPSEETLKGLTTDERAAAVAEWKRRHPEEIALSDGIDMELAKADAAGEPDPVAKRTFTAEQRRERAANGHAMKDGSFPIDNKDDLRNAIQAIGRAKNPDAARRHIISRARALGAEAALPDSWRTRKGWLLEKLKSFAAVAIGKDGEAQFFNDAQANVEANEYASDMISEICEAVGSLRTSVCSIMGDDAIADKQAAIETTFEQFKQHIQGVVPEGVEQAMAAAGLVAAGFSINPQGSISKEDGGMADEVNKELEAAQATIETQKGEIETMKAAVAKMEGDLAVAKLDADEVAYATEKKLTPEQLREFAEKDKESRKKAMTSDPVAKAELPEAVRKQLAEGQEALALVNKMQDEAALAAVIKRVGDAGVDEPTAKTLHAVAKVAPEHAAELEKSIVALTAQVKAAGLFKEIGKGGDATTKALEAGHGGASGHGQLMAKAEELRKADPKLTDAQAYSRAYLDPANAAIVAQAKAEGLRAGAMVSNT